MKINIPFTKKHIIIKKMKGCSMNGINGRRYTSFDIIVITKIGNGDDGNRTLQSQ